MVFQKKVLHLYRRSETIIFFKDKVELKQIAIKDMRTQELKNSNCEFTVLREKNSEDCNLFICRRNEFKYEELHDCYDRYGQEIGAEGAEDYSVENYYCSDLRAKFLEDFRNEINCEDIENVDDLLDCEREDVLKWVENWREENESATMAKVLNYFNGHNWQSIIINCDIDEACNYEEVAEEVAEEVLTAYENAEFGDYEFGKRSCECGGFEFIQTQYSSDPFEVTCIC